MEQEEFDKLGYWEKQVACSKLWAELATPIFTPRDNTGRIPIQAQVRKTNWPGQWIYTDVDGYKVVEDMEVERWTLVPLQR